MMFNGRRCCVEVRKCLCVGRHCIRMTQSSRRQGRTALKSRLCGRAKRSSPGARSGLIFITITAQGPQYKWTFFSAGGSPSTRRMGLPIIIHSRDANDETVRILKEIYDEFRGIMHCFGGTPRMAEELMDLGFLISLPGT